MELKQIKKTLQKRFDEILETYEKRKIIFWEDQNEEFTDDWDSLHLDDIKVKKLTTKNQFSMKHLLEVDDTTSSYLIYTNINLHSEDNWLLDTVIYSHVFTASRLELIIDDLKINSNLKGTLEKYERFFERKIYYQLFKNYSPVNYTQEKIEAHILSAICGLKNPNFDTAIRTILMANLNEDNKYIKQIKKYFSINRFWEMIELRFGYTREAKKLKTFFMHLVVTSLSVSIDNAYLNRIKNFIASYNQSDVYVFVDHWMHHKTDSIVFNEYVEIVEKELALDEIFSAMAVEDYKNSEIFPMIDQSIIKHIASNLFEGIKNYDEYLELIELRRTKHYYSQYSFIYNVLFYTIKIEQFKSYFEHNLPQNSAENLFKNYHKSYYKMDTYYRKFYVAYDESEKYDFINKLQEKIEHIYTNWFIGDLSAHWSQAVRNDLVQSWQLPEVKQQQRFYKEHISSSISKGDRVFVIVSDAMRYEIGVDLTERLNSETLGSTNIDPMLGVVPSITKLGMAALLPHKSLNMDESGRVIIDDKIIEGYTARKNYIESKISESIVVKSDEFSNMNKAKKREVFKGKKLIYIYHDKIDSIGDNSSSENQVFKVADESLDELFNIVQSIRYDLSGTNIYITADHGFLYQRSQLEESDKIVTELDHPFENKKRYALSTSEQELSGQIQINMENVLREESSLSVYVPNGSIRNRIQGPGANFVHGGASLQEIVVPLIFYKNKRSDQKNVTEIESVKVEYTSQTKRITNKLFNLSFFQNEKVVDKRVPVTVDVYFEDQEGVIISNVERIIADKTSSNPSDRLFSVQFALESIQFDRDKDYYLIIKDTETEQVTSKILFEISLGVSSDFDFFS